MSFKPAFTRGTSLAAGALVLVACGSAPTAQNASALTNASPTATSPQPSGDFNDADVMFAQMMSQHHRQAIEMADLAETRASDTEVKELAERIKASNQAEKATMQGWLKAWGKPMPTDGMMHGMPGAMSGEDMQRLESAKGAAFDKEFLQMMIAHHKGAIAMARTEKRRGENPEAKQLADTIMKDQQAEVEQMQKMLDRLQ